MENPIKMDDLGGPPPIFGNTHIPRDLISNWQSSQTKKSSVDPACFFRILSIIRVHLVGLIRGILITLLFDSCRLGVYLYLPTRYCYTSSEFLILLKKQRRINKPCETTWWYGLSTRSISFVDFTRSFGGTYNHSHLYPVFNTQPEVKLSGSLKGDVDSTHLVEKP